MLQNLFPKLPNLPFAAILITFLVTCFFIARSLPDATFFGMVKAFWNGLTGMFGLNTNSNQEEDQVTTKILLTLERIEDKLNE